MKRVPWPVYILWFLLMFLSIGAFYGGLLFIGDPSGESLGMNTSYLDNSPFNNFLLPGIILLFFNGIFPLIILSGFFFKKMEWAGFLNIYKDQHWPWTYSLYLGIILILWIDIQIMMIGYDMIQSVYAIYGVIMVVITLLPGVRDFYRKG